MFGIGGHAAGLLLAVVTGLLAAGPAAGSEAAMAGQVAQTVERARAAFAVPGMAVTLVRDGETLLAAGYGVAEVDTPRRVDARTLFRIGSVSKAFTAAALAILVDEQRLGWDDPVIDYLPEFRMHDPWVTREFTVRDLLTHRSGLPLGAGDLLLFPEGNATVGDVIGAMRHFEPTSSFRSEFAYDNLLYVVAGEVVARISGVLFTEFLQQRLLDPLGMDDCYASVERAPADAELATPHVAVDGEIETTTPRFNELVAAAGGIVCSARSMGRWMAFVLAKGATADGERLISETGFAELIEPVTLLGVPDYLAKHAGAYLNAYALGWGVSTFHGRPMLSHGGGVWGMTTFLAVLPRQNLAVFATGNQLTAAPRAVVNDVLERVLGVTAGTEANDWITIIDQVAGEEHSVAEEAVAEAFAARDVDSSPSLELEAYTGTYRDPWYGEVEISLTDDGRLWFQSRRNPPLRGPLEHFQHDTFVARWEDRQLNADAYVWFGLAPDGSIERARMRAVSPATDFSFDFHHLDLRPVAES